MKQKSSITREVEIIDYRPEHQPVFAALNYVWIEKHFQIEEEDRKALDRPEEKILNPGGAILLARYQGEIVGTVALIRMPEGSFELAKMAVAETSRGKGIGYLLGKAAIEKARQLGAKRIYLESNTKLPQAIHLYYKLGFEKITGHPSPYSRCNIQMELNVGAA